MMRNVGTWHVPEVSRSSVMARQADLHLVGLTLHFDPIRTFAMKMVGLLAPAQCGTKAATLRRTCPPRLSRHSMAGKRRSGERDGRKRWVTPDRHAGQWLHTSRHYARLLA